MYELFEKQACSVVMEARIDESSAALLPLSRPDNSGLLQEVEANRWPVRRLEEEVLLSRGIVQPPCSAVAATPSVCTGRSMPLQAASMAHDRLAAFPNEDPEEVVPPESPLPHRGDWTGRRNVSRFSVTGSPGYAWISCNTASDNHGDEDGIGLSLAAFALRACRYRSMCGARATAWVWCSCRGRRKSIGYGNNKILVPHDEPRRLWVVDLSRGHVRCVACSSKREPQWRVREVASNSHSDGYLAITATVFA